MQCNRKIRLFDCISKPCIFYLIMVLILNLIMTFYGIADYEVYQYLYESAGGYLLTSSRDPAFTMLAELLSPVFSYIEFRIFLTIYFIWCSIYFLKRMALNLASQIPLISLVFLTPIVLMKFGIQIREGLGLSCWFLMIAIYRGFPQIKKPVFWLLMGLSSLFHLGVLPIWIATLIVASGTINLKLKFILIAVMYFIISLLLTGAIGNFFLAQYVVPRETNLIINVNFLKVIYWSLFPIYSIWVLSRCFGDKSPNSGCKKELSLPFIYIGVPAILGLSLGGACSLLLFGDVEAAGVSNILRISSLLVTLIGFQASLYEPRSKFLWVVGVFLLTDCLRNIFPDIFNRFIMILRGLT